MSSVLSRLGVLSVHPQGGDAEVHEFLQTLSCAQENAAHGASQPCWEDEHLSRNVYFVHRINTVFNYYEKTSSRVILEGFKLFKMKHSQEKKGKYKCFGNSDKPKIVLNSMNSM